MKLRAVEQRIEQVAEQTNTASVSELKKQIAALRNELQHAKQEQGGKLDALRQNSHEVCELHLAGRLGPSHFDLLPVGIVSILRDLRAGYDQISQIQIALDAAEDRHRVLRALDASVMRPKREAAQRAQEARHCEAIRKFNEAFDGLLIAAEHILEVRSTVPDDARDWWPSWPQPADGENLLQWPRIHAFDAAVTALRSCTYRPRRTA